MQKVEGSSPFIRLGIELNQVSAGVGSNEAEGQEESPSGRRTSWTAATPLYDAWKAEQTSEAGA